MRTIGTWRRENAPNCAYGDVEDEKLKEINYCTVWFIKGRAGVFVHFCHLYSSYVQSHITVRPLEQGRHGVALYPLPGCMSFDICGFSLQIGRFAKATILVFKLKIEFELIKWDTFLDLTVSQASK